MTARVRALRTIAVAAFVVLALASFGYAVVRAWNDTGGDIPALPRLLGAGVLTAVGLVAGAAGWAVLLGGDRRVDHAAAVLVSQLGKYVPGGIFQATGQVALARSAGVRLSRGVTAFTVFAVTQALAGCAWALLLAFTWSNAALGARILVAVGALASVCLLDRRWMVWALGKVRRARNVSRDLVPPQRSILVAWAGGLIAVGTTSTAYLLILSSFGTVHHPLLVVSGYATAWTVGFLVVPIPSGVGIREAVLVGILHGVFPTPVLVAASVYHRLVVIASEGLMAAIASHRVRPSRLRAARSENEDVNAERTTPPSALHPEHD